MCVTSGTFEALKKEAESEKNWHYKMMTIGHDQDGSPSILLNIVDFIINNNLAVRRFM